VPLVPAGIPILVVALVAIVTAIVRHRTNPGSPDGPQGGAQ